MIKWLICLLWGHDFNRDESKYLTIETVVKKTGQANETGIKAQCMRCRKFKYIARV